LEVGRGGEEQKPFRLGQSYVAEKDPEENALRHEISRKSGKIEEQYADVRGERGNTLPKLPATGGRKKVGHL